MIHTPDGKPPEKDKPRHTAEIINFPGFTRLNVNPNRLLSSLSETAPSLDMIVVVALDKDGGLLVATSQSSDGDTLMLLKRGEQAVMEKYNSYEDK